MATVFKGISTHVARLAGDSDEMDVAAHKLLAIARARATKHRLTGAYLSKLKIENVAGKKGVRDRLVVAGDKAAMSIEYGHAQRTNNDDPSKSDFRWIPGQYILTGAINEIEGYKYSSFGIIK